MLFATSTEEIRCLAQTWLDRAAHMPRGSWDRERLITAARLNQAFANLIECCQGVVRDQPAAQLPGCRCRSPGTVTPASFSDEMRASCKCQT